MSDHSVLREVAVLGHQVKHRNAVGLARATRNAVRSVHMNQPEAFEGLRWLRQQ